VTTIAATVVVQALLIGIVLGLGPFSVAASAILVYFSVEAAIVLVELGWMWNPGSITADSYSAMMILVQFGLLSLVVYGVITSLLLKNNVDGCFLLLVLCIGAREMGYQMFTFSKGSAMRTRAAGSFLAAFSVALTLSALVLLSYGLTSWATSRPRPMADQVLFALLAPVVRLFVLLSAQRYLAQQLLRRGILDALTLYSELALGFHFAVDVPLFLALLTFGGVSCFALAICVFAITDVSYVHALTALQEPGDAEGFMVTFALQRPASVLGSLMKGIMADGESSALLSSDSRKVSTAVTASMGDKDCARPIGGRVAVLLDEYHELHRYAQSAPKVWQLQELKAAVSAHSLAGWCATFAAILLLALSSDVRFVAQMSWLAFALRALAVVFVRCLADLLFMRELRSQFGEAPIQTVPADATSVAFHAAAFAIPATACLAAM
jgi:hypothetical protein